MPGRHDENVYRYGFQGQEKDDEIKGGEGTSLNYEYRMYDPRIGRFFAVDPLASKYPFYSPYAFSGNRVIDCIELEGLEPANYKNSQTGEIETFEFAGTTVYESEIVLYTPSHPTKGGMVELQEVIYTFESYVLSIPEQANQENIDVNGLVNATDLTIEELKGLNLGDNGKLYKNWNGNGSVKVSSLVDKKLLKAMGDAFGPVGIVLDGAEIYDGYIEDGATFGPNTAIQTAGVVGGAAGAWAGGVAGATIGAGIGSVVPVVGTAVGGVVGGIIGGIIGSVVGESVSEAATEAIVK